MRDQYQYIKMRFALLPLLLTSLTASQDCQQQCMAIYHTNTPEYKSCVQQTCATSCSLCIQSYQSCVTKTPGPHCLGSYDLCMGGCSWSNKASSLLMTGIDACNQCEHDHDACIDENPYEWKQCFDSFDSCIGECSQTIILLTYDECRQCQERYQQCVRENPYAWQACEREASSCSSKC
ncbi:hypothetical protein FGO68_gene10580 [Halteria grandinella]|uniref:Uncharacterized protein n=1 Tax=Halteria grandinella TaxID=5974 RepID=A0A8J8SYW3_HALGN|nr:hypothetical protein FGO68_gene10580 [Halteria grandinella]